MTTPRCTACAARPCCGQYAGRDGNIAAGGCGADNPAVSTCTPVARSCYYPGLPRRFSGSLQQGARRTLNMAVPLNVMLPPLPPMPPVAPGLPAALVPPVPPFAGDGAVEVMVPPAVRNGATGSTGDARCAGAVRSGGVDGAAGIDRDVVGGGQGRNDRVQVIRAATVMFPVPAPAVPLLVVVMTILFEARDVSRSVLGYWTTKRRYWDCRYSRCRCLPTWPTY